MLNPRIIPYCAVCCAELGSTSFILNAIVTSACFPFFNHGPLLVFVTPSGTPRIHISLPYLNSKLGGTIAFAPSKYFGTDKDNYAFINRSAASSANTFSLTPVTGFGIIT